MKIYIHRVRTCTSVDILGVYATRELAFKAKNKRDEAPVEFRYHDIGPSWIHSEEVEDEAT